MSGEEIEGELVCLYSCWAISLLYEVSHNITHLFCDLKKLNCYMNVAAVLPKYLLFEMNTTPIPISGPSIELPPD